MILRARAGPPDVTAILFTVWTGEGARPQTIAAGAGRQPRRDGVEHVIGRRPTYRYDYRDRDRQRGGERRPRAFDSAGCPVRV